MPSVRHLEKRYLTSVKFRETNIIKIIKESLAQIKFPEDVAVSVHSNLADEACWMDHETIRSMLTDLERNAVEAMPQGGALTVSVSGDEQQITVEIRDTGKGIPEENMPMLFTPFFTTKPVGEGTGLSLPQAFASAKAHHGDISITSNTDSQKGPTGTSVQIMLPRKQKFQAKDARVILHEE